MFLNRLSCLLVGSIFLILNPGGATHIEEDFKYFVSIFPGIYDNSLQVFDDMAKGLPPGVAHFRFTADIYAEDIPIFPSNVKTFYVQEYALGDPLNIVRQKIYAFQIDETNKEIILKFYSFVQPTKYINAQDNPGLLKNLTWNDLIYVASCDVKWTRVELKLFRSSPAEECQIVFKNVSYYISDTNDLTPSYLTVDEKWTFVSNGSIERSGTPFNMTRQIIPRNKLSSPSIRK